MRTKVRRLYDIANVLSSLKLIEKTHLFEARKPAFRWFGLSGKRRVFLGDVAAESRKRTFGVAVTNICFKRKRVESSADGNKSETVKVHKQIKVEDVTIADTSSLGQDSQQGTKSYQFGPFAPVAVAKVSGSEKKQTQIHDWESHASTSRPQYHNQAE